MLRILCLSGAFLIGMPLLMSPVSAQAPGENPPLQSNHAAAAFAPTTPTDPALAPAERLPQVDHGLLLDAIAVDQRYVAVGERGHVLLSTDGTRWLQARTVPTRSTLTAVAAAQGQLWAGGHDGVILHSLDGGQNWTRQRVAPWSLENADPTYGVPVLDLLFTDTRHGYAIGAYSLLLETTDGGANWSARSLRAGEAVPAAADETPVDAEDDLMLSADDLVLEEEADPHLNAIARTGSGGLLIVGERGTVFRSRDDGATWQRGKLPYGGSMFGVLAWAHEHVLVFGLRGNVFESHDLGETWTKVETGARSNLLGAVALANGGAVLVGAEGSVLFRKTADAPFQADTYITAAGETPTLAAVLPHGERGYVLFGDHGVDHHAPKP